MLNSCICRAWGFLSTFNIWLAWCEFVFKKPLLT